MGGAYMGIVSIDLGTTNVKVAVYNNALEQLSLVSRKINYLSSGEIVEFNAEAYFNLVIELICQGCEIAFSSDIPDIDQIVLTGQAESLVAIDKNGIPVRNAISWLDSRSKEECRELSEVFDPERCYLATGQPQIIPTWPITKILWLKKHEPHAFKSVYKYMLLKDYILYRLTGEIAGEHSIYNFSHYFDIVKKQYLNDILDYCGVLPEQLPALVEPCTVLEKLLPQARKTLNFPEKTTVNVGTLDHFAGMIGTGNIREGIISESTGTVLSIATMVNRPLFSKSKIPLHCGPFRDSYILLPVCESGGISLEWFKNNFFENVPYSEIDKVAMQRKSDRQLTFLPYLTGISAPDFNEYASGVFFGIKATHDRYDFALAIMEGVSCLLRKNIDYIKSSGINVERIISTGGGAKSALWSQLKADFTNHPVAIPHNKEAACLGAAIIGSVCSGFFNNYEEAISACVSTEKYYTPSTDRTGYEAKYNLFNELYNSLAPVYKLAASRQESPKQ